MSFVKLVLVKGCKICESLKGSLSKCLGQTIPNNVWQCQQFKMIE